MRLSITKWTFKWMLKVHSVSMPQSCSLQVKEIAPDNENLIILVRQKNIENPLHPSIYLTNSIIPHGIFVCTSDLLFVSVSPGMFEMFGALFEQFGLKKSWN